MNVNIRPLVKAEWITGLLGLYREALAKGRDPREVGLPPLPDPALYVLEAGGRTVVARIASEEDWERAVAKLEGCGAERSESPSQAVRKAAPDSRAPEQAAGDGDAAERGGKPTEASAGAEKAQSCAGRKRTSDRPAPQTLLRQIVSLAALKGVELPEITTAREAREWYRKLQAM